MQLTDILTTPTKTSDPTFVKFIESLNSDPLSRNCEVKKFSDCEYWNYYLLGISFMTKSDFKTIDTIFCYSEKDKKFQKYCGELPLSISITSTNVDIVKLFNKEPEAKGGGGSAFKSIPIWIEYSTVLKTSHCLVSTFNFVNSDWRDLNNPLHFVTLFLK